MSPELQTALSALLGGFGMLVLKEWVPGLARWFTGRSAHQKSLIVQAEDERDAAEQKARVLELHAVALTRYLVQSGWDPLDDRLKWPIT